MTAQADRPDQVDYAVIGAGSAGCVLANRLSADEGATVLLLEAGPPDDRPEIHALDGGSVTALLRSEWSPQIDWGYSTEPQWETRDRRIPIAQGKVLGGGSSVNALMWVRGNRADYDLWGRLGNKGWDYSEVLPYFIRAEDFDGPESGYRGRGGPVRLREVADPTPIARAFVAGTRELGLQAPGASADYNGPDQTTGGFIYQITVTEENQRASTAVAYLRPAMDRPNLTVRTGAMVTRIIIDGGRAVGVEYVQDGVTRSAEVRQEVVLSAGAFQTPKLLMLSGIGPAGLLAEQGIPCLQNLRGVGRNLQDHFFAFVCYGATEEHPPGAPLAESGLFTNTGVVSPPSVPDLQYTFGSYKFLPATAPMDMWNGPGFTFAAIAVHPYSRGEVRLRGTDPALPAEVRSGYLTDERDLEVLLYGVKLARRLTATSAFDRLRGPELAPGPEMTTDDQLRDYIRANGTTLWHPVGTCRMGDDDDAVVDHELRVHGIDRLRIADASIMPLTISGNTNAPVVMIGERAADLIRTAGPFRGGA